MTTFTVEELDEMADRARRVAEGGYDLPDKSQVAKLSEFARSTPSVGELLLFIRYQGSRASQKQQQFFEATANAIEDLRKQGSGEAIERARRFLGLLVRATVVARQNRSSRVERGGGR
ncbi:MAG: hypothetical protein KatS3mg008_1300 [Acidimicrobiales bacterium]|nr:MAG: hypothetical protein KatS3mg008_1300 [Acidimicrobiales bacterium]